MNPHLVRATLRKAALLVPPIKALYLDHARLAVDNRALTITSEQLEAHLVSENRARTEATERLEARLVTESQTLVDTMRQLEARLVADNRVLAAASEKLEARLVADYGALAAATEKLEARLSRLASSIYWRRSQPIGGMRSGSNTRGYAIIGSAGRTATQWITTAFNLHDQVFFVHGSDLEPRRRAGPPSPQERLDDFHRISQQRGSFDFGDLDAYFDILESLGEFIVYGNVHGLTPPPNEIVKTTRRRYYCCALVRHPILRIQSFINRWQYETSISETRRYEYSPDFLKNYNPDLLEEISAAYRISNFDEATVLFIKALRLTVDSDYYYLNLGIPVYNMERLVNEVEYFLGLFHEATAGLVEPTDDFLNGLRELRPVDQRGESEFAGRVLFSWAPWQQRYFYDALAVADLIEPYHELGYNLRSLLARCDARLAGRCARMGRLQRP